jgi:hypothetical protein
MVADSSPVLRAVKVHVESKMPPVFAYDNPTIKVSDKGYTFSAKCDERRTYVPLSKVSSVDLAGDTILIFLTDDSIVQLNELSNSRETYDLLIGAL